MSGRFRHADGVGRQGCRRMGVRANAETPLDAETARKFGAEGIGLCRTEHMFFDPERIGAVRQMIMASDEAGRRAALARLLPFQREDFRAAVHHHGRAAGDDPPARSAAARVPAARATPKWRKWRRRWAPMSRRSAAAPPNSPRPTRCWAIAAAGWASPIPEIYEMQARAIFEGAIAVAKETGNAPHPGDHDPAGRHAAGTGDHPRAGGQGGGGGVRGDRPRRSNTASAR